MAQYRFMMIRRPASQLPRDVVVSSFYIDTDLDFAFDTAEQVSGVAKDAATLFATTMPQINTHLGYECRVYNLNDAPNSPPRHRAYTAQTTVGAAPGPMEVALCLSYYNQLNAPRRRGRMYLGPWPQSAMEMRPSATTRGYLATLAAGIANLGGVTVDWCIRSTVDDVLRNVTHWYVDDEWDTQRRRGLRATTRTTGTTSESGVP